jgi:hypothetical protein
LLGASVAIACSEGRHFSVRLSTLCVHRDAFLCFTPSDCSCFGRHFLRASVDIVLAQGRRLFSASVVIVRTQGRRLWGASLAIAYAEHRFLGAFLANASARDAAFWMCSWIIYMHRYAFLCVPGYCPHRGTPMFRCVPGYFACTETQFFVFVPAYSA